jgi:hypothetical protein
MSEFNTLKTKAQARFNELSQHEMFLVDLGRNDINDAYLAALPEEVRQEHNCSCCRHFLRDIGGAVAIIDNEVETLWNFEVDYPYSEVPKALKKIVLDAIENAKIGRLLRFDTRNVGIDHNLKVTGPDSFIRYEHFHLLLPNDKLVTPGKSIASVNGLFTAAVETTQRALSELTMDAVDTVLELINQNSLYRGAEFKNTLVRFRAAKKEYDKLSGLSAALFAVEHYNKGFNIRNSVIGTLLDDLSSGVELDRAVRSYEAKVAPSNYKRPTALVTKGMIETAEKEIKALGLLNSLYRRYAVPTDIPVSKVLFVNRAVRMPAFDAFAALKEEVPVSAKEFSRVEEVPIDTFLTSVLPTATSLEVLLERPLASNFMSLVAPVHEDAPHLFQWDNGISWAYQDGLSDSVKGRVKAAGGSVEGELRVSLEWFNLDDLDLSVVEPSGNRICYSNKVSPVSGGFLDVDMNAGDLKSREAVENIVFKDKNKMRDGVYTVFVHNFRKRESIDVGFNLEIECSGETLLLGQETPVGHGESIKSVDIHYSKERGITEVVKHIGSKQTPSKEIWGLFTNRFQPVSMVLNSPNYWEGNAKGNRHTFFILEGTKNPNSPRGIFNEYLKPELLAHKRVFELLGSKMIVEDSEQQLSGLGFSSTQRNSVTIKVTGKTTRVIKVNF